MGPSNLLKEGWLTKEPSTNLLDQVSPLCTRLIATGKLAQRNLTIFQSKMKLWYDKKVKINNFKAGDIILVLARYCGPYLVTEKINNVNYVRNTLTDKHPMF